MDPSFGFESQAEGIAILAYRGLKGVLKRKFLIVHMIGSVE